MSKRRYVAECIHHVALDEVDGKVDHRGEAKVRVGVAIANGTREQNPERTNAKDRWGWLFAGCTGVYG